ncbi:MAG TPA: anhydro-N-acetylmuramic acid kinase [Planctomycetota bacterium]|nr:anhydro-N-acetylmuramic acid kinase [Planctomycetota bacterium]
MPRPRKTKGPAPEGLRLVELAGKDPRRVLGLTSGTSVDGVDAALVEIAGCGRGLRWALRAFVQRPYPEDLRADIFELFETGQARLSALVELEARVGAEFAEAGLAAVRRAGLSAGELDLAGSNGQTIWHSPPSVVGPELAGTWQAGSAAILAERLGAPVVHDFRARDIAAGGEGAPLAPYVNWLMLTDEKVGRLVLSLGGIASLTYLPPAAAPEQVLAFHAGPASMVVDEAVRALTGGREHYDAGGRMAAAGRVSPELLQDLMRHPFFRRRPPRSTGRHEFGARFAVNALGKARRLGLSGEDLVATVTALSAQAIGDAVREHVLPAGPVDEVVVSGGGAHNAALVEMIRRGMPRGASVQLSNEFGLPVDAKEALCVAVLANETLCGHPNNLPSATGARHPVIMGSIVP